MSYDELKKLATPGEISLSDNLLTSDGIIELFAGDGDLPIADVHGPGGETGNRFSRSESIANARLILWRSNNFDRALEALKRCLASAPHEPDCARNVSAGEDCDCERHQLECDIAELEEVKP